MLRLLGFFTILAGVLPAAAADLEPSLTLLQGVAGGGVQNVRAAEAWRVVSTAGSQELPQVLSRLDGATPLGANYLRAAVEAIVDREVARGTPPALAPLEAFLRDVKNPPRSRRLAYEVIVRLDPTAEGRWVPTFLNDPSTELRRDAVQRLIDGAQPDLARAAQDAEAKRRARETLEIAFQGARDLDQIEQLEKDLKPLGVEVDLPRHFGFVLDWKLIGPFANKDESAFDVVYPPEQEIKLDAQYPSKEGQPISWVAHTSSDPHGMVNLNKALLKASGVVAYAFAEFESAAPREVQFRVGCINAFKLWVNGELIDARNVYHSGTRIDQYISTGRLKAGKNTILLKVLQNEQKEFWAQDWQFQLRVCDPVGTAVLSADRLAQAR